MDLCVPLTCTVELVPSISLSLPVSACLSVYLLSAVCRLLSTSYIPPLSQLCTVTSTANLACLLVALIYYLHAESLLSYGNLAIKFLV